MGNDAPAQSRREAREAQQKKNIRKWIAIGGAGAILLSGGGILAYNLASNSSNEKNPRAVPSSCATTQQVTVETTPAMAEVLNQIPVDAHDCIVLDISSDKAPNTVAQKIIEGKNAPNLWIPDSSTRAELTLAGKAEVITQSDSLAKTPGIIVTRDSAHYDSWNKALADTDHLRMSDPKTDSGSFMAFINASGEVADGEATSSELSSSTGHRAQTIGVDSPVASASELLAQVSNDEVDSAIVTESDYSQYLEDNANAKLSAYVPSTGSGTLNYPMYQPTSGSGTNKTVSTAADKIKSFVASDAGKKALAEAGLRQSDAIGDLKNNLGELTALNATDSSVIANMWTSYSLQSAPMNALIAVDASGSMDWKIGDEGKTRMDITMQAISEGSKLFPERDSMGLWKFAYKIDGEKDYQELVPIRNLAETVDGATQREVLLQQLSKVTPYKDSLTGLNDTTLAAFRSIKANYQTAAANVVVIVTDGEDTDDSSISEEELIKTVQTEQNADAPVYFVFIGISSDANMDSLNRLASQVGGEAFPASSADDIQKIFKEALSFNETEDVASDQASAEASQEADTAADDSGQ